MALDDLEAAISALQAVAAPGSTPGSNPSISVYALGTDAALFGHNAVEWATISGVVQSPPPDWTNFTLSDLLSSTPWLDLDNVYPVVAGSWVVLVVWPSSTATAKKPVTGTGRAPRKLLMEADVMSGSSSSGGAMGGATATGSTPAGSTPAGSTSKGAFAARAVFASGHSTATLANAGEAKSLLGLGSAAPVLELFATQVSSAQVVTRSGYLMQAKVTSLILGSLPPTPTDYGLRTTRALAQTAQWPVADVQVGATVGGYSLTLAGPYLSLQVGQAVVVTGVLEDQQGATASETSTISGLALVDGYTVLSLSPQLAGTYIAATVTVNANVAPATHGETTTEILGSGDATQTFQSFALKQPPLTYVSATTPTAAASTLSLTVNGVQWSEVPWLYGSTPTDQVYMVILGPDGNTYVQFGDGVTGARPGTGTNNIVATYRHGIGSAGLARAGQVSNLLSRPLGLKAATNPLASNGAADPETIDEARPNVPLSVTALGRIVSLEDVGDFAAASAGIAKAAVNWAWDGTRFVACVTVAGVNGAPVVVGSDQYTNLLQSMDAASDGTVAIDLCDYQPITFGVAATITAAPNLSQTAVLSAVLAALGNTFAFGSRAFGQPVYASEIIAAVQNVPGVVAMTLDGFNLTGSPLSPPASVLPAAPPWAPRAWSVRSCSRSSPGLYPGW